MLACGARPNFMKVASLAEAFSASASGRVDTTVVHTGQHYDENMSSLFFDELGLPKPDVNLACGSGSHAVQTADIMQAFEPVLLKRKPDWLFVVGDVNSTLACALVAAKLGVRIAHVEAGLRSFDRRMPEEINRVLTDRLADLLFVTEPAGMENLRAEGVAADKCHLVGDTMADTLLRHLPKAHASTIHGALGLQPGGYVLVTLHRPDNVDDPATLGGILDGLASIAVELPVVFPAHPRTIDRLERFDLHGRASAIEGLRLIEPLGYLDFLKLMADARLVISDSGGIQEETTILGTPCMTLRETTERPYTLEIGTNRLVRANAAAMLAAFRSILGEPPRRAGDPHRLTDGGAGKRIVDILLNHQN